MQAIKLFCKLCYSSIQCRLGQLDKSSFLIWWNRTGVSNWNCSVGNMRTYKVNRVLHYDADATIAVPELNFTSYFLPKVSW